MLVLLVLPLEDPVSVAVTGPVEVTSVSEPVGVSVVPAVVCDSLFELEPGPAVVADSLALPVGVVVVGVVPPLLLLCPPEAEALSVTARPSSPHPAIAVTANTAIPRTRSLIPPVPTMETPYHRERIHDTRVLHGAHPGLHGAGRGASIPHIRPL